jgi:hypothetical protein
MFAQLCAANCNTIMDEQDTPTPTTSHEPATAEPSTGNGVGNAAAGASDGSNGVADAVVADDNTEAGALAELAQTPIDTQPSKEAETAAIATFTPQIPTDDEIVEAMRDIIKDVNVGEITLRVLMALLEKKFSKDLTSRKGFVKEQIAVLIAEQAGEEEEVAEEVAEAVKEAGEEAGEVEEAGEEEAQTNEGEGLLLFYPAHYYYYFFLNYIDYFITPITCINHTTQKGKSQS